MKHLLAKRLFLSASVLALSAAALLVAAPTARAQGDEIVGCLDYGCNLTSGVVCCDLEHCGMGNNCVHDYTYKAC